METVSDFFKELKGRISHPLISSFIISWIVFNYKIFIGLFFYSIEDLGRDNYESYLDLIAQNLAVEYNFLIPIVIAVIYTFAAPFVKGRIDIYNAWILSRADKKVLEVLDESVVPFEKYMKGVRENDEQRRNLESLINREKEIETKLFETERALTDLSKEHRNIKVKMQEDLASAEKNRLDGYWRITLTKSHPEDPKVPVTLGKHDVRIVNGEYYLKGEGEGSQDKYEDRILSIKTYISIEGMNTLFFDFVLHSNTVNLGMYHVLNSKDDTSFSGYARLEDWSSVAVNYKRLK